MLKLFGIALIYLSGITLAGILAVGLFVGLLLIKKQISHMTEEKWDIYFRKLSNHDFFIRGLIIYIIALCLIAWLSFYIFSVLDYQYAKILSKVFILVGLGYVVFEYIKHKDEIIKKLNRLHE